MGRPTHIQGMRVRLIPKKTTSGTWTCDAQIEIEPYAGFNVGVYPVTEYKTKEEAKDAAWKLAERMVDGIISGRAGKIG
jgi:hypothetical protein